MAYARRKGRRAQGTLEFMLSYGWIILAVSLMIAALVFIGLPYLRSSEPERCAFPVGSLKCSSITLANGGLGLSTLGVKTFELKNELNKDVRVCGMICSQEQAGTDGLPANKHGVLTDACGTNEQPLLEAGGSARVVDNWRITIISEAGVSTSVPVRCYDAAGQEFTPSVGGLYRGKLYVLYSFADEFGGGNARVATGELVARANKE